MSLGRAAQAKRRSPKEAVKRARRDLHRQALVAAAERVFAARGYEGTHMQEVAAEAGLALATVYGLVGGKQELYAEVHRDGGRALLAVAMNATAGQGSAFAALLAGIRAYVEYLVAHPDYLRLHLLESQPWALQPRFTSGEQGRLWREGLELTVTMFRAAIAEGAVVDEDPALLGRLMIAAHQVFLGEWVEQGMSEAPESLVARMQAHVERAFGTGRRPGKRNGHRSRT